MITPNDMYDEYNGRGMSHELSQIRRKQLNRKFRRVCWQWVRAMSNKELFTELSYRHRGNDYDGVFTYAGEIIYEILNKELKHRLSDWLSETPNS